MADDVVLRELEGLHTVETVAEQLGVTRQSALNFLSRMKKQGHVTVRGGGRKKRLYKITARRQLPRSPGMFDIINKYSPMKLMPWYDHQVHGPYGPEDALVDAIQTKSFRVILSSMRLFSHITDWKKLYRLAKERDCWQQVGALYDVARMYFKVRRMPAVYAHPVHGQKRTLTQLRKNNFPEVYRSWSVLIPFNERDMEAIL